MVLGRSSRHRRGTSSSSHQARIAPSQYHQLLNNGEEVGGDGPPGDRISVGELTVPDAKKSLPTATVTVAAKGFLPVTGVPLDLLGRGTHVYRMTRLDVRRTGTWMALLLSRRLRLEDLAPPHIGPAEVCVCVCFLCSICLLSR